MQAITQEAAIMNLKDLDGDQQAGVAGRDQKSSFPAE